MLFEQLQIGGDKNLAYLFGDREARRVAAVDPGCNPEMLARRIRELGADCSYIFATHGHYDHVAGIDELKAATGARVAGHPNLPGVEVPLEDGRVVEVGAVKVRAIHCIGHAPDSVLLVLDERKVLTGDEMFVGGVGITRSESQARLHYTNLHAKLLTLPDELEVYPGHDYGAKPSSTIGEQRRANPYFQQRDFESFWHLRQNWKPYVKEHGLKWG